MKIETAKTKARARNAPQKIRARYFSTVIDPKTFGKPTVMVND